MKTEEKEGIRCIFKILFSHQGRMITKVQDCRPFVWGEIAEWGWKVIQAQWVVCCWSLRWKGCIVGTIVHNVHGTLGLRKITVNHSQIYEIADLHHGQKSKYLPNLHFFKIVFSHFDLWLELFFVIACLECAVFSLLGCFWEKALRDKVRFKNMVKSIHL